MKIDKPDSLIKYLHALSLVEQRILNLAILSYQNDTNKSQDGYFLNIGIYAQLYGMERSTAYRGLIDAIGSLAHKTYLNILTNQNEKFFDEIRYERSGRRGKSVFFKFSKATLYQFQHSDKTTIDLEKTVNLQSKYASFLYELFLNSEKSNVSVLSYTVEEFRNLIGLHVEEYKVWSNLKKRVIDESLYLINKNTDIYAEYILFRQNKKTSDISFTISLKQPRRNGLSLLP